MKLSMKRTIFVAGGTPLNNQLIEDFLAKGKKVIAATFTNQMEKEESSAEGLLLTYPWVPGSSLSPRNILIQGTREQGEIQKAFLVYATGKAGDPLHRASSAAIQRLLDQKVKSYLFLLKELVSYFIDNKEGELTVALLAERGALRDPITAGAYGMFRSLVMTSLHVYEPEPLRMSLFETESGDHAGFLDYMMNCLENESKKGNRIYTFPEKGGLFSRASARRPF